MKYEVIVHNRAARYLKSLPGLQKQRITQSLRELEDGIAGKTNVKSTLTILAQEEMSIRSSGMSAAHCP